MKTIACLILAVSAVAFTHPSPASAASFGVPKIAVDSQVEQAQFRRCRLVKRVTYRYGVRRVVTSRVCRGGPVGRPGRRFYR